MSDLSPSIQGQEFFLKYDLTRFYMVAETNSCMLLWHQYIYEFRYEFVYMNKLVKSYRGFQSFK